MHVGLVYVGCSLTLARATRDTLFWPDFVEAKKLIESYNFALNPTVPSVSTSDVGKWEIVQTDSERLQYTNRYYLVRDRGPRLLQWLR